MFQGAVQSPDQCRLVGSAFIGRGHGHQADLVVVQELPGIIQFRPYFVFLILFDLLFGIRQVQDIIDPVRLRQLVDIRRPVVGVVKRRSRPEQYVFLHGVGFDSPEVGENLFLRNAVLRFVVFKVLAVCQAAHELLLVFVAALLNQGDGTFHVGCQMQQVPHLPVVEAEPEIRIVGPGVFIVFSPVFLDGIAISAEQRIPCFGIIAVIEGNRFEFIPVQVVFQDDVAGVAEFKSQGNKILDGNVDVASEERVRSPVQHVQRHRKGLLRFFRRFRKRAERAQQQAQGCQDRQELFHVVLLLYSLVICPAACPAAVPTDIQIIPHPA